MALNSSKPKNLSKTDYPEVPTLNDVIDDKTLSKKNPLDEHKAKALTQDLQLNAEMILQEVLDDFVPHIEAELRKRLSRNIDTFLLQLAERQKR